ncbi:SPASM domain-containing protein [Streptomyces tibetensis]|uniref:SPASM domain-containing protein n=1 Tax=Streptomyces tibetensis TaxID=2382123 RepID=UPI0038065F81
MWDVVTPQNWESVDEAVAVLEPLRVDYVQFRPAALVNWEAQPELLEAAWSKVLRLAQASSTLKVIISSRKWHRLRTRRSFPSCETSSLVGIIKADGTVPFCCLRRDSQKHHLGSILTASFEEVWFGLQHQSTFTGVNHAECPIPCKHDAYNETFFGLKAGIMHPNFL